MRYIVSKIATLPWLESFAARMAPGPLALQFKSVPRSCRWRSSV